MKNGVRPIGLASGDPGPASRFLHHYALESLGELAYIRCFGNYRNMASIDFVSTFAALAQEHRLAVFRLLMREGPNGLPAGEISRAIEVPPSTLSSHLTLMCRAGLLRSTRQQRQILYAIDVKGTRRLIEYLTEDCCQGRPEICGYSTAFACEPALETTT